MAFISAAARLSPSVKSRLSLLTTFRNQSSYRDITIPVPWRQISGRACGPSDGEPLLMLHGFMDNCGTFKTVQPQLPANYHCVNIDLPGHGLSSHLPAGVTYDFFKGLTYISLVRRHLGWTRFSLLGHSLGAGMALVYAACFPEAVRSLVVFDPVMLTPPESSHPDVSRESVLGYMEVLERQRAASSPSSASAGLPYHQLRLRVMSHAGLTDPAAADALMERGCRPVTSADPADPADPAGCRTLYRLASDPMHRVTSLLQSLSCRQYAGYLSRLRSPLLMLLAEQRHQWSTPQHEAAILEAASAALGDSLELAWVPGGHHVHLCSPERVVPRVAAFLERMTAADLSRRSTEDDANVDSRAEQ